LMTGVPCDPCPTDALLIETGDFGLGPASRSPTHVPDIKILVQGKSEIGQRTLSCAKIPELRIHQHTVVIEENVFP
jgi:hypothetical protein